MGNGVLGLDSEEFWRAPTRTKAQVQRRLSQEGFEGLLLDGPGTVLLDGRSSLPLAGWVVQSFREAQRVPFAKQALVVCVYGDGSCFLNRLYDPRIPARRRSPVADEDPGEGKSYRMFHFDLAERLPLEWKEQELRTRVILQERCTDAVISRMRKRPAGFQDPAVAAFLAKRRTAQPTAPPAPRAVFPPAGDPFPVYRSDAPSIPAEVGLQLEVPEQAGATCRVAASFRVPLQPAFQVTHPGREAPAPVGDPQATAIVPLTLVVIGSRVPGPWALPFRVPSYSPLDPAAPPATVGGQVVCDLRGHRFFAGAPAQRYLVYAFCGPAFAGPFPCELSA